MPNRGRRVGTLLYRLWDEDRMLLYVGITDRLDERMEQHRSTQPWWPLVADTTLQLFWSRKRALEAEGEAIRGENPKYNIAGRKQSERDPRVGEAAVRYWKSRKVTGWQVVGVSETPSGTIRVELDHPDWSGKPMTMTDGPSERAIEEAVRLAEWEARRERRARLMRARGEKPGQVYQFPERIAQPNPDPPEDLAA